MAQTIFVDDFGAVGDGATDDRAAIQNAIWNLKSNGGTLKLTSGKTYIISQGLDFYDFQATRNYLVTTTGEAKATIKIADGTPLTWLHWGFRLSESRNITVKNLVIDGNRATRNPSVETSGTDVFFIDGASDGTRLVDLDLINSPADNLYIVVHENQGQTMMTDFEMHHCKLENGFRNNMSVISGANFKIIGCEFNHANGTDPQSGIDFEPNQDSAAAYSNMTVEGCSFKNNVRYGVELTYIIAGSGNSIVKNNYFENNGILIASKNNEVHHNVFTKQDHQHLQGGAPRDGIIYFHTDQTCTGNDVHHNYFFDNPMPAGSHLVNFMYNAGGGNHLHHNYAHGNTVDGFVANNTNPATTPQIIDNNLFLTRKELGCWTMDSSDIAGSTLLDRSDFNHDGTLLNLPTNIAGVVNQALDFMPDNRAVSIIAPTNGSLDAEMNITLLAWINWQGINPAEPEQVVFGRGGDWALVVKNSGAIALRAPSPFTATEVLSPADTIPINRWKRIAATYDGRTVKLYVDGIKVASQPAEGALGTTSSHLFIGSSTNTTHSFNGAIDDVKFYPYTMQEAEIEALFSPADIDQDHLVDAWEFDSYGAINVVVADDDTDGDGYSSIQEMVFGLDATHDDTGTPVLKGLVVNDAGSQTYTFRYHRPSNYASLGLEYHVQTSSTGLDAADWSDVQASPSAIEQDGSSEWAIFNFPVPATGDSGSFFCRCYATQE